MFDWIVEVLKLMSAAIKMIHLKPTDKEELGKL